jgi:hypothetical protein
MGWRGCQNVELDVWHVMSVGCSVRIAALEMRMSLEMVLQTTATALLVQVLWLFKTKLRL